MWEDYQSDQGFGASFAQSYDTYGLTQMFFREHAGGSEYGLFNTVRNLTGNESPFVSPDVANEESGDLGLTFDRPIRRNALEIRKEARKKELMRQSIIDRGEKSFGQMSSNLAAGFLGAAADPLNIASAFVPIVREARATQLATRLGTGGGRIAAGAIEGGVGAAIMEAPTWLLAQGAQADYTMYDSLVNVAFGSVLGGGLHYAGGYASDRLFQGKADNISDIPDRIDRVNDTIKEQALKTAISDFEEGRPINVDPILRTDESFNKPVKTMVKTDISDYRIKELSQENYNRITKRFGDNNIAVIKENNFSSRKGADDYIRSAEGNRNEYIIQQSDDGFDVYKIKNADVVKDSKGNPLKFKSKEEARTYADAQNKIAKDGGSPESFHVVNSKVAKGKSAQEHVVVKGEGITEADVKNISDAPLFLEKAETAALKPDARSSSEIIKNFTASKSGLSDLASTAEPTPKAGDIKELSIDEELDGVMEDLKNMEGFIDNIDDGLAKSLGLEELQEELRQADVDIKDAEGMQDSIIKFGMCMGRG